MQILHVASEVAPFAKVGGLADVVMGLSRELTAEGHDVHVLIPSYQCIEKKQLIPEGKLEKFTTELDGRALNASVRYMRFDNVPILLLDTDQEYWGQLSAIYAEDVERFTFFCRAVTDWLKVTDLSPDVIHVHDWPTALLPVLAPAQGYKGGRFVFTMHNFEFQGQCQWDDLERVGLKAQEIEETSLLQDPHKRCLNLVKGGLLTADRVTTVSPTYAKEVMTPEFGFGLEDVLVGIKDKFSGILNGIDHSYWDPQNDEYLSERYSASQGHEKVCMAKMRNKKELFSDLDIPLRKGIPLLSSVTRLVPQKGIWLLHDLFSQAEQLDFQVLLLGSLASPEAQKSFESLDLMLRKKGRGAVLFGSDERCAHRIFAASDMFVAPSLFEPCGLTQLISLRYGTVPIVRKTGGFADTVVDVLASEDSNGFSFSQPDPLLLQKSVVRALEWYGDGERWRSLIMRGKRQDFSWRHSVGGYMKLYKSIV